MKFRHPAICPFLRFYHQPKPCPLSTSSYIFRHSIAFWWMSRRFGSGLADFSTGVLSKPKNEHARSNNLANHHDMACAKHMNQMSHNLTLMSGIWKAWGVNVRGLRNNAPQNVIFVFGRLRLDVSMLL